VHVEGKGSFGLYIVQCDGFLMSALRNVASGNCSEPWF
jgi:hypothetical protein